MSDNASKLAVTEAHVEAIIDNWGKMSLPLMARKLGLQLSQVEEIIAEIQKLKRVSNQKNISVIACFTSKSIKSIVRCVGAKRGYCK